MAFDLNEQEKNYLLGLARNTISERLGRQTRPLNIPESAKLQQEVGGFVTLHKKDNLRGCIGYVTAKLPLIETIKEMSISAAFKDPRFKPVIPEEIEDIDIEISVLSPLQEAKDIEEIEVGKHGLLIQNGFNSGLLLPQVPIEQGWDKMQFLEALCQKAGLPSGCWQQKESTLYSFTAEVFGELSG